ncbi:Signal transduction histidine kinase [Desulfuromusa kysingii]|uniref:histidine kinase n=1 Tax=Desulfuromusa kysingii TaxID=37625 RepID=A0A1H4AR71_9BACT|nr:response regulator [Desulfuromusa kysingii]SEA38410.1 Signal transduction histidine kinase [Desulfuromusa kysingii]
MNLKTKSIILICVSLVFVLLASYGVFQLISRDISAGVATMYAKEQVSYNRFRALQPLKQELVLARKLAESTVIRNWFKNENDPELHTAAMTELEDYRQFFSDHSYFCAIQESGHYYFKDKDSQDLSFEPRYTLDSNQPGDLWFSRTLEQNQDYQLNVDYDQNLGLAKVWINVTVRDDGQPIGIIGTGLDLSGFISTAIVSDHPGVTSLYIDANGAIQAHSDEGYIDFRTIAKSKSERKTIFQHFDSQQSGDELRAAIIRLQTDPTNTEVITVKIDGVDYLVGIGALADIGWYNLTLLETDAIIGLEQARPFLLALLIGLLLFSVTLTFLFNRLVIKRIDRLKNNIQVFSQGRGIHFPTVTSKDEIGQLETSFQKMANTLQQHTETLENSVAEQTRELTETNTQLGAAYLSIQRIEARRKSLNEISKEYLTNGSLEQSLELLVVNAAKFVGAQGGRFLHCSMEGGHFKITAVSKVYWAKPSSYTDNPLFQEALSKHALTLLESSDSLLARVLKSNQTTFLSGEQFQKYCTIPLPNGHPGIESLTLTPISIGKEILGVILLANCPATFAVDDDTGLDAFAAEAALLIHADSREVARAAAEETARLRNTFLANMSHELRTPLNIIIGMNKLLQGMENSSTQRNYLEKIGFSAQQLLELISGILDLSQISEGKQLKLKELPFQTEELFYGIAQLLAFRQDKRKVEIHVDVCREIPPVLIGDTLRVTQILNNLLSNALKFTPQGSATLKIDLVETAENFVRLAFSVTDTGIGITTEQMKTIFQPFVQVDNSTTREQGGSGLGLALCQQLCQLMGGEICVESTPGQGSTFYFELPFKIDPTANQEQAYLQPRSELQGTSILVANSCPDCNKILPPMLEAMQFKVDAVASSSDALIQLNNAKEQSTPYLYLLIGMYLEDMSGLEFSKYLTTVNAPTVKKILMANPADIADISRQLASLDLTEVLSIPASPSDLLKAIVSEREPPPKSRLFAPERPAAWQQMKVLLVDDNEMGRELGRALLENVGLTVCEAKNGLEAVNKVKSEDFDLVLMDIQMPELDGLSATRAIRALDTKETHDLPIIAMTAHSLDEHHAESLAAGMNSHITKPIELDTLYAELLRWLPGEAPATLPGSKQQLSSEFPDLQAALPGIDVIAGIHRVVGNQQLYLDLLSKYVKQYATTEQELERELRQKRHKESLLRVHSLKGVAGSLGATHLYQLAGELEEQLRKKQPLSALEPMLAEHRKFLHLLQELPTLRQPATDKHESSDAKIELHALLEQMLSPLTQLQAHGVTPLLIKMQENTWPEEYHDSLFQLEDLISRYQFKLAAELVQNLLDRGEN